MFFLLRSGSRCIRRIPAGSEVFIKAVEDFHVPCGNFKVKNIGIFEDASTIRRFGNHHQSMLQRPADEDLRRRFGFRMARQLIQERQLRPGNRRLQSGLSNIFWRLRQVLGPSGAPL